MFDSINVTIKGVHLLKGPKINVLFEHETIIERDLFRYELVRRNIKCYEIEGDDGATIVPFLTHAEYLKACELYEAAKLVNKYI